MTTKPTLSSFNTLAEIMIGTYERYLPTAFDESLTLLEKVNKVIQYLNEMGKINNEIVAQWNEVMVWVMGDGLTTEVNTKLDSMVTDGTFNSLINQEVLSDINTKVGDTTNLGYVDLATAIKTIDPKVNSFNKKYVPANTIVLLGDSITNQNTVANSNSDRGFFVWGNAFMNQTFKLLKNAGVSGQRTDHIYTRIDVDVLSYNPSWCMVLAGTNDLYQGYDSTTIFNNLVLIYEKLLNAGIYVIASTLPPSSTYTTNEQKKALFELNRKIKTYCKETNGMYLVDMGSSIIQSNSTDPVLGSLVSDGLHPSALGAVKMGEVFANEMKKHIKIIPPNLSYSNKNPENILLNGTQYGTGGQLAGSPMTTGVVADNWLSVPSAVTVVASKEKRSDTLDGEWQVLTCSNGDPASGIAQYYTETTAGFVVGDKMIATLEMEVKDGANITQRIDVTVEYRDASNAVIGSPQSPLIHESAMPNLNYAPKGIFVVQSPEFTLPANTAKIRLMSKVYLTSGVIKYGRAEIRKV